MKHRTGRKWLSFLLVPAILIGLMQGIGLTALAEEPQNGSSLEKPKIIIEMGAGHDALAAGWADYLNSAENQDEKAGDPYFCNASADGSTVTVYYDRSKDPGYHESWQEEREYRVDCISEAQRLLSINLKYGMFDSYDPWDEGEQLCMWALAQDTIDHYTYTDDIFDEMMLEGGREKVDLPMETTFYAIWNTNPLDKVEVSMEPPVCGSEVICIDFDQDPLPEITVPDGVDYAVSPDRYWQVDPGEYGWDYFSGVFSGGEEYYVLAWIRPNVGYYFTDSTTAIAENAELLEVDMLPWFAEGNPYISDGSACVYLGIKAVHDPADPVIENEVNGFHDEVVYCKACNEEISRTTVTDAASEQNAGISVAPKTVEWTADEGYKGAADDGIETDAIYEVIQVTSTGEDDVEFVLAGFKDMSSYEQFTVAAGGMEVTVAPKEGLAPGTYTCTVVIGDWDDRFEDVEIPVTFTVTAKEERPTDTPTSPETGDDGNPLLWLGIMCASLFGAFILILLRRRIAGRRG